MPTEKRYELARAAGGGGVWRSLTPGIRRLKAGCHAWPRIAAAAARHGKAWGRPVADQEQLQALHAQGARLLAYGGEFSAFLNMLRERGEEFDHLLRATEQEGG